MTDPKLAPPPELVRQWMERTEYDEHTWFYESYIAEQAAQWGADQELEACCEWFVHDWTDIETADNLRAARRPGGSSLKSLALRAALIELDPNGKNGSLIIRALEQLDD
jgi:hypothetical protein